MGVANTDEKSIFNEARRIESPDARRRYLGRACGDDRALRARVEALLRVHDEDSRFLRSTAAGLGHESDTRTGEGPGSVIGPYTLVSQLGEGGMGVVFLAEQSAPVCRKVALKIIRPGLNSRTGAARFEVERQALALMDHPNIAKVLDGGTIPAGRSYFVMELVRGVPITRYCDAHRLTPRQRMGLFVQVCRGVQHAHQKGIVHRDLKPSNVLVPTYDGRPVPKIIDFGLAKTTARLPTDSTVVTQVGLIVGTPEYMSPEQAEPDRYDIDTRSDVYSLGVLLYELLTGTTPLDRGRIREAGIASVLYRICHEEPPRPSARLAASDLSEVAADRGGGPGKLVAQVRGELDWITMKCLEKDRARRYQTADELARDVERYLRNEPVEASPPRVGYRLRKFARRHRAAMATAAAFALLLVGGTAASVWQAVRATAAERRAVAERDSKEDARRQARRALNKLTDETVERLMGRQVAVTADDRAFLRQVLTLHEEFAAAAGDDPEARAGVADARYHVGLIRHRLGEFGEAEEAFRAAIDAWRGLAEESAGHPDYRHALANSHARLGGLLRETGRPQQAEGACTAAIEMLRKLADDHPGHPDYGRDLAAAHNNYGNVLAATGRADDAELAFRTSVVLLKALAAGPPARPEDRRLLAASHQNLANLLYKTNRFGPAEESYLAAGEVFRQLAAEFPNRPDYRRDLAQHYGNLGPLYTQTQRRPQAEEAFRAAGTHFQKLADEYPTRPDYRSLLAANRSNLGNLLTRMKRYPQAEEAYLAARDGYDRLAADFPLVPDYRSDLSRALVGLGLLKSLGKDHAAARRLIEQALPHDRAALGVEPKNPTYRERYRTHCGLLAEVLGSLGDHAKAADTADELARVAYEPAEDEYTAAWVIARCMGLAGEDERLTEAERAKLARHYADRAVGHLQGAARNGFKDAARVKKEQAFGPLQPRDDFRKFFSDLSASADGAGAVGR